VSSGPIGLSVGDKVRIVPNHACVVTNMVDTVLVTGAGRVEPEVWPVPARGDCLTNRCGSRLTMQGISSSRDGCMTGLMAARPGLSFAPETSRGLDGSDRWRFGRPGTRL
jgi:hypothetical protein